MADTCYQFTSFQNKRGLILVTEWRSGNIFAWHFQSVNIFTANMYPSLMFQEVRWLNLKGFPPSYKITSFLFSSVYLSSVEHPSIWLFVSCKSQDDLICRPVAELYLNCNWVYFADSVQKFVYSAPICMVHRIDVCCVCQQIKSINKNKVRPPGYGQHNCVFFVPGQWRWSHQP